MKPSDSELKSKVRAYFAASPPEAGACVLVFSDMARQAYFGEFSGAPTHYSLAGL